VDPLLKKLQHRGGPIAVFEPPDEVRPVLASWTETGVEVVAGPVPCSGFVLAFARSCAQIEQLVPEVLASLSPGDPVVWMAYPKRASKRYRSDVGRADSWQALGDAGFEAVRQVAIDADWSALRFRRVERIRSLSRDPARAMSRDGRRRTGGQGAAGSTGSRVEG
jgi:hypothetical protein